MNERLARWLSEIHDRYRTSPNAAGEGLESTVYSTLAWPSWLMLLLILASAAWFIWVYRHERGSLQTWQRGLLGSMRLAAMLVIVFMLEGWMHQRHRTDLPELVLAFDASASMATRDPLADSASKQTLLSRLKAADFDEATRLNIARLLLLEDHAAALRELENRFRLRLYVLGEKAVALPNESDSLARQLRSMEANNTASRLGKCLRDVLEAQRGRSTAAVILFSDGINTEGIPLSETAEYARRKTIPLYTIGLGNAQPPRDVRLADLIVEKEAFVNDLVHFDFKVSAVGGADSLNKGDGKVVLRTVGSKEVLAEEAVQFTSSDKQFIKSLRLTHRPAKEGQVEYELVYLGNAPDANPENDRLRTTIHVHDATIRVLLVQSGPSFEYRFLKTMLERELNPHDEAEAGKRGFRVVLQDADVQFPEIDKSALAQFPVSRDELFQYDVLLIGDANPALLSRSTMQNIVDFTRDRGGGVVFIVGPRFNPVAYRDTPLAAILPVNPETVRLPDRDADLTAEVRPRPTTLGLASPPLQLVDSPLENAKLWSQGLPGLYWMVDAPDLRPAARVLLEHPTKTGTHGAPMPLLAVQYVGSGQVMFQGFDGSYRWRYRTGDQYFARYWIQMIRYLARGKVLGKDRLVELTTDREAYRRGETVLVRLQYLDERRAPAEDDGAAILLERAGAPRKMISLRRTAGHRGIFEATLSNLGEGSYRAWLADAGPEDAAAAKEFSVVAPPGEEARLEMDVAELKAAADISGGRFAVWSNAKEVFNHLPPGRQVRIESLPPEPLWNSPVIAAAFVTLLVVEWLARKGWGML